MQLSADGPVVIFGGSFDPPTRAHTTLPPLAAKSIGASRLVYVPAAVSPHKTDIPPTAADHRLAMLQLALDGCSGAEIDRREIDRGGVSRTIDTLEIFRREIDQSIEIRLLIGTDQMRAFDRWHRWQDILQVAAPLVMVRGDDDVDAVFAAISHRHGSKAATAWADRIVTLPRMNESSTRARASSASLRDDVDPSVSQYITDNGLYQ